MKQMQQQEKVSLITFEYKLVLKRRSELDKMITHITLQ